MAKHKFPGVLITEVSTTIPVIESVETAVPAFIGYTEKALDQQGGSLMMVPTRISSLQEYEILFGPAEAETTIQIHVNQLGTPSERIMALAPSLPSPFKMYYQVALFFANGGGDCYIVAVGTYATALTNNTVTPVILREVNHNGVLGLKEGLDLLSNLQGPSLLLFPDAVSLRTVVDFYELYTLALQQCQTRGDRFTIMDTYTDEPITGTTTLEPIQDLRNAITLGVGALQYGGAYFPYLETTMNYRYDETQVVVIENSRTATPLSTLQATNFDVYGKCVNAIQELHVNLPPGGAVAGAYARLDLTKGVWKAPANVSLQSVIQPTISISRQEQQEMNVDIVSGKSVNAIRQFAGKGALIWGTRTLAGNDNEYRYISVRRFGIYLETSINKALEQFIHRPNNLNSWVQIKTMINNFMTLQWRDGAFSASRPEDAFFTSVGLRETMTQQDIDSGRLIVHIGFAPVRPSEFIVLRFLKNVVT